MQLPVYFTVGASTADTGLYEQEPEAELRRLGLGAWESMGWGAEKQGRISERAHGCIRKWTWIGGIGQNRSCAEIYPISLSQYLLPQCLLLRLENIDQCANIW